MPRNLDGQGIQLWGSILDLQEIVTNPGFAAVVKRAKRWENQSVENVERATGIESATFSLEIKITAPLFSQLTKPLGNNQRACKAPRACSG